MRQIEKILWPAISLSSNSYSACDYFADLFENSVMLTWSKNRNAHIALLAGLLIFLLLISFLRWKTANDNAGVDGQGHPDKKFLPHIANPFRVVNTWEFDVRRDGDNYGLSHSQCSTAFPKLYSDIDEMVARRNNNRIAKAEFDSVDGDHVTSSIRTMVYDDELYIIRDDGLAKLQSRGFATLHAINRALLAFPDRTRLPNCEFRINVGDYAGQGNDSLWVYTKPMDLETENLWLMPDFGMYDWPEAMIGSYTKSRRDMRAIEEEVPWKQKTRQLVWRGFVYPHYQSRVDFLGVAQDKPWADVATESVNAPDSHMLPIADFCRWMFVADIKGASWSGGAKYKHNCHSVFVSHPIAWREIYTGAMVDSGPEQNWVSIQDDWSNLEETMQDLIANPIKAKRIADNSVRILRDRYLTPAAEACYWRRLIQGYASVSFEPDLYEGDKRTWRGTLFSSVALMGRTKWESDQDSLVTFARVRHP